MEVFNEGDLTAAARIRNAALAGFARDGVASTSIREVARAAGVSPGLVQHHFKTKAVLQEAVNAYVITTAARAFEGLAEETSNADTDELLSVIGDRITALVREQREATLYVARSAAQGEAAGLAMFDGLVALAREQVERLAAAGTLRADVDQLWAALHVVVFNLGTILLEPAIERHLPASFRDPEQLERWNKATTKLTGYGVVGG